MVRVLPASLIFLSLLASPAFAKPASAAPAAPPAPSLLPSDFAGWTMDGRATDSTAPEVADDANAQVLKEYGFQQLETAHYTNGKNKLTLRAIRFGDASGAYGAFTFYRPSNSIAEQIGRTAAWNGSHVLFWSGATLVDGVLDHTTPMTAAELRDLAKDIPQAQGSANLAPPLPSYLPHQGLDPAHLKYSLGAEAYARSAGVLPPSLVNFGLSAEAVTANYSAGRDGDGQLTLLMYPTPQMAAARLRDIDAFLKAGNSGSAWPQPLAESQPATLQTRRSGPIVAITSGSMSSAAAHKLLNQVNYQADVVWNNPQGYVGEGTKVAKLLVGIFALTGILGGAAILLGLFLGGGRALARVLRGKPASRFDEENELISLRLRE